MDILEIVGGGKYDSRDEENYIDAVQLWNDDNIEAKLTYREISALYQHSTEPVIRVFELSLKENSSLTYEYYVIMRDLENLRFQEDYFEREESGYVRISISDSEKTIIFSTTEDVDFRNLPLFISPPINRLSISGGSPPDEKERPIALLILIIILIIVAAVVLYVILQEWYRRKYEKYLFKNRNDYYNMITYINNSKGKGLTNDQI
ncbi:MAG: hypothetical protein IIB62_10110, partial [Proteobacteria bacterium]|nr:hypothetical protein [Pseudomonadota bacterium]